MKYGVGSNMLWGSFSAAKTGRLVRIEGMMNAVMYRDILDDSSAPLTSDYDDISSFSRT